MAAGRAVDLAGLKGALPALRPARNPPPLPALQPARNPPPVEEQLLEVVAVPARLKQVRVEPRVAARPRDELALRRACGAVAGTVPFPGRELGAPCWGKVPGPSTQVVSRPGCHPVPTPGACPMTRGVVPRRQTALTTRAAGTSTAGCNNRAPVLPFRARPTARGRLAICYYASTMTRLLAEVAGLFAL